MRHLLKNGNKPYDLRLHPHCGALKRKGGICKGKAMKNGKCRLHGGKSTGSITQAGKEKCANANFKSGLHSKEIMEMRKLINSKKSFLQNV